MPRQHTAACAAALAVTHINSGQRTLAAEVGTKQLGRNSSRSMAPVGTERLRFRALQVMPGIGLGVTRGLRMALKQLPFSIAHMAGAAIPHTPQRAT